MFLMFLILCFLLSKTAINVDLVLEMSAKYLEDKHTDCALYY